MFPAEPLRITKVTDHDLAPDGSLVVAVVDRHVGEAHVCELWTVRTDGGGEAQLLTQGHRDLAPSIAPDGTRVAFIRCMDDRRQLCILDMNSQDMRVIVESGDALGMAASKRHIRGVSPPRWSPDGAWIAFVDARPGDPPWPGSTATIVRELPYQFDGRGSIHGNYLQISVIRTIGEANARRLTSGYADHWDVCWRPDGRALCYGTDERVAGVRATVLHESAFDSRDGSIGGTRPLTDGRCTVNLPAYTSNGDTIVFIGIGPFDLAKPDIRARNVSLWSIGIVGNDLCAARMSDTEAFDVDDRRARPLVVLHGGAVMLTIRSRGTVALGEMSDHTWHLLLDGLLQVTSYAQAAGVTTAIIADATHSGDLFVVANGKVRQLTDFRASYADVRHHAMTELDARAPDGYPVHGWIMLPDSPGPHPMLLLIHGGPDTQWGFTLNDEAQAYVSAGYGVLLPNPRGSAGYGEAHARILNGQIGVVDVADVLALLDAAIERGDIDPHRIGILGRSYGGFLTAWLVAHHGARFRAAVGECGIYDWASVLATSDIGWQLVSMVGEDPQEWRDRSPLTFSRQITKPFLVMQYLSDLRIPCEQGHRLFAALWRAGTPTELVQFAGGPHSFAETGLSLDRAARLGIIIDWFDRWLRVGKN